jgi:hypothetical protein
MGPIHPEPLLEDLDADPVDSAAAGNGLLLGTAAAIAVAVGALDLLTTRVHLPIAYIVPLILIEQFDRRRLLWQWTAALVLLSFVGSYLGSWPAPGSELGLLNDRFVNRILVSIAIVCCAAILHVSIGIRQNTRRRRAWPHDPDGANYQRIIATVDRIVAPLVAGLLVGVLFVLDTLAPAAYNVALLYCLPLVILARTGTAAALWTGLPILVLATIGGLWLGPPLRDPSQLSNLIVNRALVCAAMLAVTLIITARLRHDA